MKHTGTFVKKCLNLYKHFISVNNLSKMVFKQQCPKINLRNNKITTNPKFEIKIKNKVYIQDKRKIEKK